MVRALLSGNGQDMNRTRTSQSRVSDGGEGAALRRQGHPKR